MDVPKSFCMKNMAVALSVIYYRNEYIIDSRFFQELDSTHSRESITEDSRSQDPITGPSFPPLPVCLGFLFVCFVDDLSNISRLVTFSSDQETVLFNEIVHKCYFLVIFCKRVSNFL